MSRIRDRFEILFSKKFRDSFALSFCLYFNLLLFNCQWSARIPPLFQRRVFRDLIIIPHLFPFVKRFFKSFLKTFLTAFQPERKCPSIISHPLAFVKRFFKSFFNFFRDFFRGCLSRLPARWQLAYYSTFVSICQAFFDKFFRFGEGGRCVQI